MPKNKGAGGKHRKKAKGDFYKPKELVYKDDGQEYAQITGSLGNGFMEVLCFTAGGNVLMRAHIRGNMTKKVWMVKDDIVLVNIREYQSNICDIVMKYTPDEVRLLRAKKQIPDNIDLNKNDMDNNDDIVSFANNTNEDNDDNDENNKFKCKPIKQINVPEMPPDDSSDSDNDDSNKKRNINDL